MATSDEALRFTRVFQAPPAEVFAAWTEPERLERWWTGIGGWVEAKADGNLPLALS